MKQETKHTPTPWQKATKNLHEAAAQEAKRFLQLYGGGSSERDNCYMIPKKDLEKWMAVRCETYIKHGFDLAHKPMFTELERTVERAVNNALAKARGEA